MLTKYFIAGVILVEAVILFAVFAVEVIEQTSIVSLATALAVIIGPIVTAILQQRSSRIARAEAVNAKEAAMDAAIKVNEVKEELKKNTNLAEEKLSEIQSTGDKVHILVNNKMSMVLEELSAMARKVAVLTGTQQDIDAANKAEQASKAHPANQKPE